jgi:hypothetical protein
MATIRGKRTCSCMAEWFPVLEAEARRRGLIKQTVDIYQLIGNAKASAGYHRSGACADFKQASAEFVKLCRNMGAAAWKRDRSDGMVLHTHLALKGCPHLTAGAKAQIGALERGGTGLASGGRDRGPRTGVQWPLRTYKQGIAWAKSHGKDDNAQEDDMPTPEEFWKADLVPAPAGSEKFWEVASILHVLARETLKQSELLERQTKALEALAKAQPKK